jgi:hypothetical protein
LQIVWLGTSCGRQRIDENKTSRRFHDHRHIECHTSGGELEQIQFLLRHASVQTTERYLGCKQNLGQPVNDLFDLGTGAQPDQTNFQSAAVKPSTPLEMASRRGIECRHGGSEHAQPVCDSRQLSLPERSDLVEVRKSHRPQSLRRCSGSGTARK